jgi:chaperonin GroES
MIQAYFMDFGTLLARVPKAARTRRLNGAPKRAGPLAGNPKVPEFPGGMRMKLKPLGDRVLVRPVEEEETTASGIVLPDTAKEKPQKGEVLAVGEGKWDEDGEKRIPLDVNEGDEVLYSKYGGTDIVIDGEDLLVLRESDLLAKVAG